MKPTPIASNSSVQDHPQSPPVTSTALDQVRSCLSVFCSMSTDVCVGVLSSRLSHSYFIICLVRL